MNSEDGIKYKLQVFFSFLIVVLIIYNIYSGLYIGEIGIPGIFNIKFNPQDTHEPSFPELIEGEYTLIAWEESSGPIIMDIDVLEGTMEISRSGEANWELWIQEKGKNITPHPRITCKGRVMIAEEQLKGVPGEGNEPIYWTRYMASISLDMWLAFGGWAEGGYDWPFDLTIVIQDDGTKILQMTNGKGIFTWVASA
jgi:hypothetical protein